MISPRWSEDVPVNTLIASGFQLAPAEVLQCQDRQVMVLLGSHQVEVQLAVADYEPHVGDRLLVLGDDVQGYYAIGILETRQPRPRLKVETSETTGATVLSVDQGDLELIVPQGAVRILAGTNVEATCGGALELQSQSAVRLSILDRLNHRLRRLQLTRRSVELQHERVEVNSDALVCKSQQTTLEGDEHQLKSHRLTAAVDRAEVSVATMLSQLGNVYQQVTGLWQLVADRTRMVVQGTSHHLAKRIYSKADDVKVKAEKIHLG